jgi:hypothetical protein
MILPDVVEYTLDHNEGMKDDGERAAFDPYIRAESGRVYFKKRRY